MIDPQFSPSTNDTTTATAPTFESIETPQQDPQEQIYKVAQTLFNEKTDWVTFFREVLGTEGIVRRTCRESDSLQQFQESDKYDEIQQMLVKLRANNRGQQGAQEATRVITVRMPESLHEALKSEAFERHTSMNKLCISKLLQRIDDTLIPHDT